MKNLLYKTFPFLLLAPFVVSANGIGADCGDFGTGGMMGWMGGMGFGGYGILSWFAPFFGLVWLAVGILLVVYLWQNINKK